MTGREIPLLFWNKGYDRHLERLIFSDEESQGNFIMLLKKVCILIRHEGTRVTSK